MADVFNVLDGAVADRDNRQTGMYAPSHDRGFVSAVTLVANQAFICRFVPGRNMTVTLVAFNVTTAAGADDAIDVGIYNATTLARLVSAGATAGKVNGLGIKTVTLAATALQAGVVYYAALSCGTIGGTAGAVSSYTMATSNTAQLFGTANPQLEAGIRASAHVLPDPMPAPSVATSGNVPLLAIRES